MNRLDPDIIDYYNVAVVKMIMEKYGYSELDASQPAKEPLNNS